MLERGLDSERLRPITSGNTSLKCKALTASWVAQLVKNLPAMRPGFNPWVGKIPWIREWLPTPGFLPAEFHGLFSPWGAKSQTRLSDFHLSYQHINLFLIVINIL